MDKVRQAKQKISQEEKDRIERLGNGYEKFANSEVGQHYQDLLQNMVDGFLHDAQNAKTADEAMAASKCSAGVQLAKQKIQDMCNLKK